ncbi:bifunctional phosphopantothenoylcysteine decarboxylase/phosphopantothenate--cysteine ligase CoaBC [Arcanobacterium haemolyticum]|nr:bifunctional phosphopantothenoylcysteine decarboxylase/phosphopantothenate--cysteine ligase CoaBC [Arcanobacterium haemolyticum]
MGGPFRVVVGVTGGIAAYKSCILVRELKKAGVDVDVVPTRAALGMVGRTTWEALSGHPVYTDVDDDASGVAHVRYGQNADLVVVAPTTANTLAKIRAGFADNLLTSTIIAARCPVILVPAMHTEMWLNPATVENVSVLRERGVTVVEPAVGRLTGPDSGPGRMPEPEDIARIVLARLAEMAAKTGTEGTPQTPQDLRGMSIVISAGGTREAIDPVRFLGNRSTGSFGIHIANAAHERGAQVTLVAANIDESLLSQVTGASIRRVVSAADLSRVMHEEATRADVVIMAAAVADFRPAEASDVKHKKNDAIWTLELIENPDILADLAAHRPHNGQIVVGFAAETGDDHASVLEYGRRKAAKKGADLMVINEVGTAKGFGEIDTSISIIDSQGHTLGSGQGPKAHVAHVVLDAISRIPQAQNLPDRGE